MDERYSILTMKLGGALSQGDKVGRLVSPSGLELNRSRLTRDLVSLEDALAAGWEPFSVLSDRAGTEVWLRRALPEAQRDRVMDPHVIHCRAHWGFSSGYCWSGAWAVSNKQWSFCYYPDKAADFEDWVNQEPHEVAAHVAAKLREEMEKDYIAEHMAAFKKYDIVVRLTKPESDGELWVEPLTFKAGDDLEILGRALEDEP